MKKKHTLNVFCFEWKEKSQPIILKHFLNESASNWTIAKDKCENRIYYGEKERQVCVKEKKGNTQWFHSTANSSVDCIRRSAYLFVFLYFFRSNSFDETARNNWSTKETNDANKNDFNMFMFLRVSCNPFSLLLYGNIFFLALHSLNFFLRMLLWISQYDK